LLEATTSSTAEGEHKQHESSKEDQSTSPHPTRRWMQALFLALFIETMAITIAIQISWQGQASFLLFHSGRGGVIGPIVNVIDTVVGVIFVVVLALYFRFLHADVKDKVLFGIFFTAGIVLGLAMEALNLIVASGVVKNNTWLHRLAGMVIVVFPLVFLIACYFSFHNSFLGGNQWEAFLGLYAGWSLGYYMSVLLAVASWAGVQEEEEGVNGPKLLCVMLAFFLAGTVAYFLVAIIVFAQKEVNDDDKEEGRGSNPTSALVADNKMSS
jgi:hypothetical protein